MENVLLVGQTPPPVNGQTTMIQELLDGEYQGIRLHHVRMTFSRTINEVGTFQIRKMLMLLTTWAQIVAARWKSQASILYFPPAGPTLIPVIRDIFLLITTRWMFRFTVFHFHAAGLNEIYPRLPWILRPLYNLAYRNADLAIFTAKSSSAAGVALGAKKITIVPNGIPDAAAGEIPLRNPEKACPSILFMGILCEGKGVLTLIEACALLRKAGTSFRVVCAGTFDAGTSRQDVDELLASHGLTEYFEFPGVLRGAAKSRAFIDADIFCFPSHYFAESSPVVLIEAMSFQLPIVTTDWRGISDIVGASGGAFIVEPKQPEHVAAGLSSLLKDSGLRASMGRKNRVWFCDHGTIELHRERIELALLSICGDRQLHLPSERATIKPDIGGNAL
jgi:glycosyltransferase involved in cell wall biosynthesis